MDLFFRLPFKSHSCKESWFYLACSFFSGLILGVFVSTTARDSLFSLMCTAEFGCVSIVGLLFVIFLPFLFSAFAVYICQSWLLIPIAFIKAFCYGFSYFGIAESFGAAGWLFQSLLMFSDTLLMPVLWWFWMRITSDKRNSLFVSTALTAIVTIVIGSFDYIIVSPFVTKLIS